MIDPKELEAVKKERQKAGFGEWMSKPTTRFMISLIPSGGNREALETLLQSAFDTGFDAGGATMAAEIISSFMNRKDKGGI